MLLNDKTGPAPLFGLEPDALTAALNATTIIGQAPTVLIPAHLQYLHQPSLVANWWSRLMAAIREPAAMYQGNGERVVLVASTASIYIKADGSITSRLWSNEGGAMQWVDLGDKDIMLTSMPVAFTWLDCIAGACRLEVESCLDAKSIDFLQTDLEDYVRNVFARFKREIKRHCDLRLMRRKVAKALDLNADAMRLSRRMIALLPDFGSLTSNDLRPLQYNLALKHIDKLLQLERELPVILPLYAALLGHDAIAHDPQPIRAVRLYLEANGVKPKTWRMLTKAGTRFFWPVRHFYKGPPAAAMVDYLQVVQALGIAQAPDTALMWYLLSRYGHAASRRTAINPGFEKVIKKFSPVARAYMALPERAGQRDLLEPMLEWLATNHPGNLTKTQCKAGWPWLVKQTRAWQARRSVELQSQATQWPVPFDHANMGDYSIRPLRTPLDLWQEARAMRHCVETFAEKCSEGEALLVSLRHGKNPDKRVATAWYARQDGQWKLQQVRGFANHDPAPDASLAALQLTKWLNSQVQRELPCTDGIREPEQMTKLRELFVRHNLHVGLDRDSQAALATVSALVDALGKYKGKFWWVYRATEQDRYESSTPNTGGLMLLAAKGQALELKGGPYLTQQEAQASMDTAPRDTEPYRPKAGVVMDGHPGVVSPINCPKSAKLVTELHWHTAKKLHAQRFRISSNHGRSLWVLWQQIGDGKDWQTAHGVAHMSREGIDEVEAAKLLLKFALEAERRDQMDRFDDILGTGLLGRKCASLLADEVWTPERVERDGIKWADRAKELGPLNMPSSSRFIARVEWTLSMVSNVLQSYYLSSNKQRSHWFLWIKSWDDNWSRWDAPEIRCCIPKRGLSAEQAARILMAASWGNERMAYEMDCYDLISITGLLQEDELDAIADEVWPESVDSEQVET
jgi:hypothetical protein